MKNLFQAIRSLKPIVIWNPYKTNDTLTKVEFLTLVKIMGYRKIEYKEDWITAYQPSITTYGNETINKYLEEAMENKLFIYAQLLEAELNGKLETLDLINL